MCGPDCKLAAENISFSRAGVLVALSRYSHPCRLGGSDYARFAVRCLGYTNFILYLA